MNKTKKHYKKFEKLSVIYSLSEERDFNGRWDMAEKP
jgi:hypothetical protein